MPRAKGSRGQGRPHAGWHAVAVWHWVVVPSDRQQRHSRAVVVKQSGAQAESVPQESVVSMAGNGTQETAAMCRGSQGTLKRKSGTPRRSPLSSTRQSFSGTLMRSLIREGSSPKILAGVTIIRQPSLGADSGVH